MSLPHTIQAWLPPTRENYKRLCWFFALFPVPSMVQFFTPWYPMGKTSIASSLNLPGPIGWVTMEVPGMLSLLYSAHTLSQRLNISSSGLAGLPLPNKIMAGMFVSHYINRAIISPLFLNPSMAPIHVIVWASAAAFQLMNGISIGSWIGGYGKVSEAAWEGRETRMIIGFSLWLTGLLANWWHDEELRKIRRDETARRKKEAEAKGKGKDADIGKVYVMPQRGLFKYVLYAHYFTEWIEWLGFWIFAGWDCLPAQTFFLNEVGTMLPRAYNGWFWYVNKFGRNEVGDKKAVVPFLC